MSVKIKSALFLLGILALSRGIFPPELFAQEAATIPEALRRPERGEAPRYPTDLVIGELGRGNAPGDAYLFAVNLLSFLAARSTSPVPAEYSDVLSEKLREEINGIEPSSYRLGGGRLEGDGSVSFMVRILGPEESITGELFLRRGVGVSRTAEEIPAASESENEETEIPAEESEVPEDSVPETAPDQAAAPETQGASEASAAPTVPAPEAGEETASGQTAVSPVPAAPEGQWFLDDLVLEERRILSEITDSYRYDFSPYERFY